MRLDEQPRWAVPADKRTMHQAFRLQETEDFKYPEKAKIKTKKTMLPAKRAADNTIFFCCNNA